MRMVTKIAPSSENAGTMKVIDERWVAKGPVEKVSLNHFSALPPYLFFSSSRSSDHVRQRSRNSILSSCRHSSRSFRFTWSNGSSIFAPSHRHCAHRPPPRIAVHFQKSRKADSFSTSTHSEEWITLLPSLARSSEIEISLPSSFRVS